MNKIDLQHLASYEDDFALWSAEQAALLRAGKLDRVDTENLSEEIESLGDSHKDEIESRMVVLLAHLLKWQFQPGARSNSWRATILEQRSRITKRVKRSPSLRPYPALIVPEEYPTARLFASGDTGLPETAFPQNCPYPIEQILDPDFFPGGD